MTKTESLKQIRDEILTLKDSPLYTFRISNKNLPVIGEGSHEAQIMFVGEAPGRNEAATGKPFCGASGKLLDELLASVNIPRASVYVTNIVKDRPPENRDPTPGEIEVYGPFLDRQIEIIRPKIIATLGRFSMQYIMTRFGLGDVLRSIGQMHGQLFETEITYGKVRILPLYHPAAAIYNRSLLDTLKEDFSKLKVL
ncbi:uracil-DNA glycosylase [Candidatus Nomurabacteria bacterium]|nr:uracil-DNA glycosylase [Candidatus Nomurabacteria bacterium]